MCYHFVFTSKSIMYRLLALMMTTVAVVYTAGAVYFFRQERWAREPSRVPADAAMQLRHPEAVLGVLQERFARQRFGDDELLLVRRALDQAPSFYQSPFFLATFHASRLDNAATVRAAYEASLRRYPANGRLHLAYAIFLLESRRGLSGWLDPGAPAGLKDPLELAETHVKRGMELERDLSWRALQVLETYRVPPERWLALTPEDALSRRHLMDALFNAKHYDAGLELVSDAVASSEDEATLERAAFLALEAKSPELALEAASKWKTAAESQRGPSANTVKAALVMSRAYDAMAEPDASNRVLEEALASVEARFGSSSRVTLEALCALANEYLNRGQTFAAESFYAQAVSRSPSYVPALVGLARSLSRAGDTERAIARYEDVLRIEPDHAAARQELKAALVKVSRR